MFTALLVFPMGWPQLFGGGRLRAPAGSFGAYSLPGSWSVGWSYHLAIAAVVMLSGAELVRSLLGERGILRRRQQSSALERTESVSGQSIRSAAV